jgi:hypothetical protein
MDDASEIGQARHQYHRRLADAQKDPLGRRIGHAPARPAGQIDRAPAAVFQIEGMQCRSVAVITNAGRDSDAGTLDDRGPVRSGPAFEDGPGLVSRCIQPGDACRATVGGKDLAVVSDRAGDAGKPRQRCDVFPHIVIDHLDAIARRVGDEHAARFGIERGVIKLAIQSIGNFDDAKLFHAQSPRQPSVAQSLDGMPSRGESACPLSLSLATPAGSGKVAFAAVSILGDVSSPIRARARWACAAAESRAIFA